MRGASLSLALPLPQPPACCEHADLPPSNKHRPHPPTLTGQTSLTKDFSTQIYRQQLLGFNAVRLPFSFKDFSLPGRTDYNQCIQASDADIIASVTPPGE